MTLSEVVVFNGIRFRRYPESKNSSDQRYFRPSAGHIRAGVKALHVEVWKAANGGAPVPDGYHVHHADHDAGNNDPSNLVLMEGKRHSSHHASQPERLPGQLRAMALAQDAAKAWHSSPEGLEWHREHGKRTWDDRGPVAAVCEQCGKGYESRMPGRFCSNKCKAQWRRDSGVDDVTKPCRKCGKPFSSNKYSGALGHGTCPDG